MRASLDTEGKLIPPRSRADGVGRMELLQRELDRIAAQLADKNRRLRFPVDSAYQAWRRGTLTAQRYLSAEASQLSEWLEAHPERDLLREAHRLLLDLVEDGVELDEHEMEIVEAIGKHLEGGVK